MRNLKLYLQIFLVSLITGSCSLEDHPPQPPCTYLGYLLIQQVHNGAVKNVSSNDYNLDQTTDHYPKKETSLRTYVRRDTVRNVTTYTSTDSDQSTYAYNDGFLMQISREGVTDQQSEKDDLFFLQYRTKKLTTKTSETTDFKYENGTLTEVNYRQTISYIPDNMGPADTTVTSKKTYQYDPQGKLKTVTFLESTGSSSVTSYENGLITSITRSDRYGNTYTDVFEYENGATKKITSSDGGAQEFTYDQKGNVILIEISRNGIKKSQYQYWFDDSPYPSNSIPIQFKGIPTPLFLNGTPQNQLRYDEVNNPVKIETTTWETPTVGVATINFTYTYNANKYPLTRTESWNNDNGVNRGFTRLTYKYGGCQ